MIELELIEKKNVSFVCLQTDNFVFIRIRVSIWVVSVINREIFQKKTIFNIYSVFRIIKEPEKERFDN